MPDKRGEACQLIYERRIRDVAPVFFPPRFETARLPPEFVFFFKSETFVYLKSLINLHCPETTILISK